jgi:hypothetical protein
MGDRVTVRVKRTNVHKQDLHELAKCARHFAVAVASHGRRQQPGWVSGSTHTVGKGLQVSLCKGRVHALTKISLQQAFQERRQLQSALSDSALYAEAVCEICSV